MGVKFRFLFPFRQPRRKSLELFERGPAFQQFRQIFPEPGDDCFQIGVISLFHEVGQILEHAAVHDHPFPADMDQRPGIVPGEGFRLVQPGVDLFEEFPVQMAALFVLTFFQIIQIFQHRGRALAVICGKEFFIEFEDVLVRIVEHLQHQPVLLHGETAGERRFVFREIMDHSFPFAETKFIGNVFPGPDEREKTAFESPPVGPDGFVDCVSAPGFEFASVRRAGEQRFEKMGVAELDHHIVRGLDRLRRLHRIRIRESAEHDFRVFILDAAGYMIYEVDIRSGVGTFRLGQFAAVFAPAFAAAGTVRLADIVDLRKVVSNLTFPRLAVRFDVSGQLLHYDFPHFRIGHAQRAAWTSGGRHAEKRRVFDRLGISIISMAVAGFSHLQVDKSRPVVFLVPQPPGAVHVVGSDIHFAPQKSGAARFFDFRQFPAGLFRQDLRVRRRPTASRVFFQKGVDAIDDPRAGTAGNGQDAVLALELPFLTFQRGIGVQDNVPSYCLTARLNTVFFSADFAQTAGHVRRREPDGFVRPFFETDVRRIQQRCDTRQTQNDRCSHCCSLSIFHY